MAGVENLVICWPEEGMGGGGQNLGPGRQFQQIYRPEKPSGRISPWYLDRVYFYFKIFIFAKFLAEILLSDGTLISIN